jgi:hypothetical protein
VFPLAGILIVSGDIARIEVGGVRCWVGVMVRVVREERDILTGGGERVYSPDGKR